MTSFKIHETIPVDFGGKKFRIDLHYEASELRVRLRLGNHKSWWELAQKPRPKIRETSNPSPQSQTELTPCADSEDKRRLDFLCKHLDGTKWADVFAELRPQYDNGEYCEKYICASTFRQAIDATMCDPKNSGE